MHSGLSLGRQFVRRAAVAALVWASVTPPVAADSTTTVAPAKVSSKQGAGDGPASSKPADVKEDSLLPGRSSSSVPGIDIPPPQGLQPNQRLDPRARKKLMEEADRRRNWIFDDKNSGGPKDKSKGAVGDRKKDSDQKPIEFESSRQRSLLEKRVAGEDESSRKEQEIRDDRQAKDRKRADSSKPGRGEPDADSDPDADLKDEKDSLRGSKGGVDRDNRPFQQAVFSDPFTAGRATSDENARAAFGGGANTGDPTKLGADPTASRLQSDRMDAILNRPGATGSARSESLIPNDFGAARSTHTQQFNDLINSSDSGGAKSGSGLLDSSKAPAASKAFGTSGGSVFGGVGAAPTPSTLQGSGFSAPSAPRPTAPFIKPQPGVLPFPSRSF